MYMVSNIEGIRLTGLFLHVVSPYDMGSRINSADIQSTSTRKKRDSPDSIGG